VSKRFPNPQDGVRFPTGPLLRDECREDYNGKTKSSHLLVISWLALLSALFGMLKALLGWFAGLVDWIANQYIWWGLRRTDTYYTVVNLNSGS